MWEQIRSNQRRSVMLVIAMGLILLAIGYLLGLAFMDSPIGGLSIAMIIWVVMSLVGYFQGDSILLTLSKAKKIEPADHPRLYNIVEEMKIASGLEYLPSIYIIEDPALNAFATGRDPKRASVAITSGLLNKLNRDELQGVIAHEIAHIKNRDVLLMAMTSVLLGTIVILAWYGSRIMLFSGAGRSRSSSRGGGGGQAQLIIMIAAIVLAILAPILAQLIYFAISRKREYLADASSALYTRNPEGLASALEKLGRSTGQLQSANKATAPMYIVNPFRKQGVKFSDLSSTHPPISERINVLRKMAGASYLNYNEAYTQVHQRGGGVIPATGLVGENIPLRQDKPSSKVDDLDEKQRVRETQNALWKANQYHTIDCQCGARMKIPPGFKGGNITCPRCNRRHSVTG
jgi:heat shock protein HtpX